MCSSLAPILLLGYVPNYVISGPKFICPLFDFVVIVEEGLSDAIQYRPTSFPNTAGWKSI
jgi:hypothetical protein